MCVPACQRPKTAPEARSADARPSRPESKTSNGSIITVPPASADALGGRVHVVGREVDGPHRRDLSPRRVTLGDVLAAPRELVYPPASGRGPPRTLPAEELG